ncbi:Cyclin-like F-box [Tolypocladium capitatum]|uniref:Cyclin-like F-box n=1 Tax=Tolypocladium capitatum TaxID=45235 RepID=A0A2K3QLF3_9HYPO|nr:Cyclin-like F-box [Tolypocladium capitatum]
MAGIDPAAITLAPGTEPFSLTPVIEDLLRTQVCISGSVFLVEGVDVVPVTKTGRWQAIRLLLGDGKVCIQALLDDAMHRFVHLGDISVGCYVRVHAFEVRWRTVEEGADGKGEESTMVYLVVRDLITIGWNESVQALHVAETVPESSPEADVGVEETNLDEAEVNEEQESQDGRKASQPTTPKGSRHGKLYSFAEEGDDLEDAFEALEALTFPEMKKPPQLPPPSSQPPTAPSGPCLPLPLPKDWHDPQTPLKLTTLRAIPHLPYAQNWSCNVLAIVASLSPVEPSRLPPFAQRTARLADPSTAKQVHLTVFLDPEGFAPRVGSAVLLTGVKNHRFDGGSLKKYASDGGGGRWWFEEPWEMGWCDVRGIKAWWAEMEAALAT